MSPKWRRRAAYLLVVVTIVGWIVSALTWAKDEPQFILALSWLAISLTALDIASTTDVRVHQNHADKEPPPDEDTPAVCTLCPLCRPDAGRGVRG